MTGKKTLYRQLHNYGESDYYPYHMPGHKRRLSSQIPSELLKIDITEIDGFDNLHQAEGILRDMQEEANALYGAEETFYLVNGSTCGILSALSAALREGGHLLMARGCHKSAYHGVYLRNLKVTYLYGEPVRGFDFEEAITIEQVEMALEENPDIEAVLIVSPTYEGRIADVAGIAEVVHKKGIPLIVDEAHGAHLGMAKGFVQGSCSLGADLVIHSVHKTLPSLTQTALLHVNGELIDRDRLKRFLHIYQTSSPSYILMASIADAMQTVREQGQRLFEEFYDRYYTMCTKLANCKVFQFIPMEDLDAGRQDVGKLIISARRSGFSGQWLADTLLERFKLQCEMASGNDCLAMFTLADTKEGYERLTQALLELDEELYEAQCSPMQVQLPSRLPRPTVAYSLKEAWDCKRELTDMSETIGKVVSDFINLYPPGIPLLAPGEVMTQQMYEVLLTYRDLHLNIQGIVEQDGRCLVWTISDETVK